MEADGSKYKHVGAKKPASLVYECPVCKQMWHGDAKRFVSAGCIFAPVAGEKVCPACADPDRKWEVINPDE